MITIKRVEHKTEIEDATLILEEYARIRNYDEALGDYKAEISGLPDKYSPPKACLLVAHYNNEAAGIVAFRIFDEGICEMKRLFVIDKFKSKGVGKQLVYQIIREAVLLKYNKMYLDTHPWMTKAQSIYQNIGFKEIDAYHYNPTKGIRFFELNLSNANL
jgi:GNAT superfamily N-acetyltransferase